MIAEQVMATYKDGIQVYHGRELQTNKQFFLEGFTILGKGISYGRVDHGNQMMGLIVPNLTKLYCLENKDAKRVYWEIEVAIKKRVRHKLLLNKLKNEQREVL